MNIGHEKYKECPPLRAGAEETDTTSKMAVLSSYSSSSGGPPSEVETRAGVSSRTSGLSESGSGGEGTSSGSGGDDSGSGSGENEKGRSGPCAHHKKPTSYQPPSEVNALLRGERDTRSSGGGSSGLSSEYGSGSGGDDEDNSDRASDTSEDKKMPGTNKKAESPLSALSNAACRAKAKEDEERRRREKVQEVQNFMSALLTLKPKLTEQQTKSIQQKAKEKRERKRKVNRLSAQRKRIRERELLDTLSEQLKELTTANQALKKDKHDLSKLVEAAKQLAQQRQQPKLETQPALGHLLQTLQGATGTGLSGNLATALKPLEQNLQVLLQNLQQPQVAAAAQSPNQLQQQLLQALGQSLFVQAPTPPVAPVNTLQAQVAALLSGQGAATAPAPVQAQDSLQNLLNQLRSAQDKPPSAPVVPNVFQQQLEALLGQPASSQASIAPTMQLSLQQQLQALWPGNAQAPAQVQLPPVSQAPTLQQQLNALFLQSAAQQPPAVPVAVQPQQLAMLQNLLTSAACISGASASVASQAPAATAADGGDVKRLLSQLSGGTRGEHSAKRQRRS